MKLSLNPNEMAIRKVYWPLVIKKELSTFFRPGVRLCASYRGYCEGQVINLRCIKRQGNDELSIPPEFYEEEVLAIIEKIYSKKISDLKTEDFQGSSPDVQNATALKFHLGLIYNISLDEISDDFYVTIVHLSFKNKNKMKKILKQLENLTQNGLWRIAALPPENAKDFKAEKMMVTLINHDYPARTPLLWKAMFKEFNIPAQSLVLVPDNEIGKEELKWTLDVLRDDERFIAGGFGVGFKDESLEFLDALDDSAANVGASNFVSKDKDGRLIGYNTDGEGFVLGLQENFPDFKQMENKNVLLLGSGGTANAIAFALAKAGAKVIIANRTETKAVVLAEKINDFYRLSQERKAIGCSEKRIAFHLPSADLILNASVKGAVGEWENYSALAETDAGLEQNLASSQQLLEKVKQACVIADVVLGNKDTPLIDQAKKFGLKTMDGLPMVISQAALAFSLLYAERSDVNFSRVYQVVKKII